MQPVRIKITYNSGGVIRHEFRTLAEALHYLTFYTTEKAIRKITLK